MSVIRCGRGCRGSSSKFARIPGCSRARAKIQAGILYIERNLFTQRFEIRETLLVAQLVQELHSDVFAVHLAIEIEHMHFEAVYTSCVDRRSDS